MNGGYAIGFGPQTRWSRNRFCLSACHKVRTASHFGIIEPFSGVKGFINERFFFLQPSVLNGLTNFHVDPRILDYFGRKIFGMQTDSKTLIMQ